MNLQKLKLDIEPAEVCKLIAETYFECSNIRELAFRFESNIVTIKNFTKKHEKAFQKKYPELYMAFENRKVNNMKRSRAGKKRDIKAEIEKIKIIKEKAFENKMFKDFPKELKYNEFLHRLSKFQTHKSMNQLLNDARNYGIKVIGIVTEKKSSFSN